MLCDCYFESLLARKECCKTTQPSTFRETKLYILLQNFLLIKEARKIFGGRQEAIGRITGETVLQSPP